MEAIKCKYTGIDLTQAVKKITEEFKNLGNDIAMHIAATSPSGVSRDDISKEDVNKEKEIYRDQAQSTNKPDDIIEKMVEGRLNKYFKENVLLEQDFVKDSSLTIENLITNAISKLGATTAATSIKSRTVS